MIDWQKVERFYLEAALKTYAGGMKPYSLEELPCYKLLRYENGNLLFLDQWSSLPDGASGGQILILQNETPIWLMQYMGFCQKNGEEKILGFLKEALLETYRNGVFHGGRGSSIWRSKRSDLLYINDLMPYGSFKSFSGREFVHEGDALVFEHRYRGVACS